MSDHNNNHSHHDSGAPHATFSEYMTGFIWSVILTVIPFWFVLGDVFKSNGVAIFLIIAFGVVQMVVHMVYFLHMNTKAEGGWLMLSLAFTLMLVVIAIVGSLWIMYHLNQNMMPGM